MSTETARLQQFKLSIRPWVPSKKIGLFYKNLSLKVAILDIGYFGALNAILVCHSFHVTNKKVLFLLKCWILSQTSGYLCIGAPDRKYQICLNIAVRNATFKHPLLKTTLTGLRRTYLRFLVFRPKLTKTKRFPPFLDHMNGKFFLGGS